MSVRKITSQPRRDNRAAIGWATWAMLVLVVGCGGGGGDDDAQPTPRSVGATHQAANCALVVTDHGLANFFDLADRVASGETIDVEAMGALTAEPVWDRWRRSFEPHPVPASRLGRNLFTALRSRDELPERLRQKPANADLVANFKFTLERRDLITEFAAGFVADEVACEVRTLLADWVDPAVVPDSLRIDLMVGNPEIRLYEDHIMLDAGLAWASGRGQLVRFLASTVYRDIATIDGQDPTNARGANILLETLRLVRNEAVPTYLDDLIAVTFDPRHRLLANASPIPDEVCRQAQRTIISLDNGLDHTLSLAAATDDDWRHLYRLFVGARSVQPVGWYMGRVIAARFGSERLVVASRSVADFFAAYQEAAKLSPAAPEAPPESLKWFIEAAPPFSDESAAWLDQELRLLFP